MFIVCFGDGLGNQMFQYAFYKSLILKYPNNKVYMDIFNIYGSHIHNGFELTNIFGIAENRCKKKEAIILADIWPSEYRLSWLMSKLHTLKRCLLGNKESYITQDDPTAYYTEIYSLSEIKSYIFKGNWVNEKYFMDIADALIQEFLFPALAEAHNLEYLDNMCGCNSVSVHIRKGDYMQSAMFNLKPSYYAEAKNIIEERVPDVKYFIFTDDKEAIDEYINIFEDSVVVEGNIMENAYKDMQLMSYCKHNIIANSTFSFWGAYLNGNPRKVVVAPSKVHKDFAFPIACSDWLLVDVVND